MSLYVALTQWPAEHATIPLQAAPLFAGDAGEASPAPLPTIGQVAAPRSSRFYRISDIDREVVAGVATRHIRLEPRIDPEQHPWREAWISEADDRPRARPRPRLPPRRRHGAST